MTIARRVLLVVFVVIVGLGSILYFIRTGSSCSDQADATCQAHLKYIGMVLLQYHQRHGHFPPAFSCDASGKPINSWRLLLDDPYLFMYSKLNYDIHQAWNSAHNSSLDLDKKNVAFFQCPCDHDHIGGVTDYVAVIGTDTMWPGCKPASLSDDDSDKDKILVIEIVNSDICWAEPRDLTLDEALAKIQPQDGVGLGSKHSQGINYVTASGEVRVLNRNIDRDSLRQLLTRTKKSP